ncbi:MAG: TIGR00268 family protein, partial [Nitrospirae bacterium]
MERLKKILSNMDTALVAFSGGVDSTLLLKAATMYVKKRVVAVTFFGEIFSSRDVSSALELAKHIGVERHIFLEAGVMDDERFRSNPIDRCYYCKRILYKKLKEIAEEERLSFILDGTNSDDKYDYRPGMKAAEEFSIVSPLLEAGLG